MTACQHAALCSLQCKSIAAAVDMGFAGRHGSRLMHRYASLLMACHDNMSSAELHEQGLRITFTHSTQPLNRTDSHTLLSLLSDSAQNHS